MIKYEHGGDIYGLDNQLEIYDFSANINPLGMPQRAIKYLQENLAKCSIYPDPFCRNLRKKISEYDKINLENIVCGNGAADLIFRIAMALRPKKALVLAPTFSEYEVALKTFGCEVEKYYLKESENFNLDDDFLEYINKIENLDIVFLCNPNNPVGNLIPKDLMVKICKNLKAKNTMLVIDECFLPFLIEQEKYTMIREIDNFSNLIILKAFTKTFAMAGFRLGYVICNNKQIIEKLYNSGQPWSVSSPAQYAGIGALQEENFLIKSQNYIEVERKRLVDALKKYDLKVYDSKVNYILFYYHNGAKLREYMKEKNVLMRDCSNYYGLDHNFSRIAVKTEEENKYFIKCLGEFKWQKL